MARSGPDGGKPRVAITAPRSGGSAPRPDAPGRGNKVVLGLVALGLAGQVLRSRRFQEGVAVAAIALGALRGIGQDNRAGTMARLSDWNKRQVQRLEHKAERLEHKADRHVQRLEHKAERQTRAVRGAGRKARAEPPRGLAGTDHQT
jgi:hypothetical protein